MRNKLFQYSLAILIILLVGVMLVFLTQKKQATTLTATKVELILKNNQYQLYCNGEPFHIKGAGLGQYNMESLAKHGANSFRTWSVNNGSKSGNEVLDEAYELGLMVCMGIEVGNERWGFDYNNEDAVLQQLERIKKEVYELKDHPALLAWGIGNELNLKYKNIKVWDAVNDIAAMIHEIDPNHPTTTMLSVGSIKKDVNLIMKHCPEIDFLSFQIYGDLINLPKYINESEYKGAYIVSEWGATGHWQVDRTTWDRPIEETSHEKATIFKKRYEKVMIQEADRCLGSFVFLWGQKQERTPTWYGLFLENGEETEVVDVMHYLWNNKWPENRSPQLQSLTLEGQNAHASIQLQSGQKVRAEVKVTDPDGDPIQYSWSILHEVLRENQSEGGDFEKKTEKIMEYNNGEFAERLIFNAPEPGEYRLFVYASDGQGHAATANIPFLVKNN